MKMLSECHVFMYEVRLMWWCCWVSITWLCTKWGWCDDVEWVSCVWVWNEDYVMMLLSECHVFEYEMRMMWWSCWISVMCLSMTLSKQHHHLILTSYSNNDIHSTTSSHHPHFIHKRMTFSQQLHHIILTSYTDTWHSVNNIITSSLLHTQTHNTHSTTSAHHPNFIPKHMTLTQQYHHIILISYTNTRHSLNNIITSSSLHTQTYETHSTTSSHHPHFIHKHTTLI